MHCATVLTMQSHMSLYVYLFSVEKKWDSLIYLIIHDCSLFVIMLALADHI